MVLALGFVAALPQILIEILVWNYAKNLTALANAMFVGVETDLQNVFVRLDQFDFILVERELWDKSVSDSMRAVHGKGKSGEKAG